MFLFNPYLSFFVLTFTGVVIGAFPTDSLQKILTEFSGNLASVTDEVEHHKEEFDDFKNTIMNRLEELFLQMVTDRNSQKQELEVQKKMMESWKESDIVRQMDILDKIKCSQRLEETVNQLKTILEMQDTIIEKQNEELNNQKNMMEQLKVETEEQKSKADRLEASTSELQSWKDSSFNETKEIERKILENLEENNKAYNISISDVLMQMEEKGSPEGKFPITTLNCVSDDSDCSIFLGKCYCVVKKIIHKRSDASAICSEKGMTLAVIETKQEDDNLNIMIGLKFNESEAHYFWVSGTDEDQEGSWYWDDDHQSKKMEYNNWCPGEPNNFGEEEHYLLKRAPYSDPNGCWMDIGSNVSNSLCKTLIYTICESKL